MEILLLRHQLTVHRQLHARPKTNWADRELIALLLNVIPRPRRARLRIFVTPQPVLRWHRDIVHRRWACRSQHTPPGRPPQHPGFGPAAGSGNPGWGYRRIHGELDIPRHPDSSLDSMGDPDQRSDPAAAASRTD